MKKVLVLKLSNGREPFTDWIAGLDITVKAIIFAYVDRVAAGGGKKSVRAIGQGVFEIKVDCGPGYRVYFGQEGKHFIILLLAGDKRRQSQDIKAAKDYWEFYVQKQLLR